MQTLKELIPVLQEVAEGKAGQWYFSDKWETAADTRTLLSAFLNGREVRVQPEAEWVPLELCDITPDTRFRCLHDDEGTWSIVSRCEPGGVWFRGGYDMRFWSWENLKLHAQILRPGCTTWEPCRKQKL